MSGTSSEYQRGYEDGGRDGYQSGISTFDPESIKKARAEGYRRGYHDALKDVRTARESASTVGLGHWSLPPPAKTSRVGSTKVTGQMVEQAWRARCFETCRDPHCKTVMDCRGPSVAELNTIRAQMENGDGA